MKSISTITLFFICSITINVFGQYNLVDPKLFATGRLEPDLFLALSTPTKFNREIYEYCGVISPTADIQTLDFKIYPNPTNQVLNIEIPKNTEGPSVEIFNAMGIMVSKTKQLNVDVSTLPTGIYFVQIKTKNRVGVKRFMVSR